MREVFVNNIDQIIKTYQAKMPDASVAQRDISLLIAAALERSLSWVKAFSDQALSQQQVVSICEFLDRRIKGEPVAYILGEWEFYSLPFKVTPDTLIPRPETEQLVERVLAIMTEIDQPSVLDLGCGSGAIAVSIKQQRPDARVSAVEYSEAALLVAKSNAKRNNTDINFLQGSWYEPINEGERFSVIVSNPPYVAHDDPHLSQGDLLFEPQMALTAGEDEFSDISTICHHAPSYLTHQGVLLIEHGYNQKHQVQQSFSENGLVRVQTHQDYSGVDRFTEGWMA